MVKYEVTINYEPHQCGMCGASSMREIVVTDGERTKKFRQSTCDNSDPWTAFSALEHFIYGDDEW